MSRLGVGGLTRTTRRSRTRRWAMRELRRFSVDIRRSRSTPKLTSGPAGAGHGTLSAEQDPRLTWPEWKLVPQLGVELCDGEGWEDDR
jgi:hypothetical protein